MATQPDPVVFEFHADVGDLNSKMLGLPDGFRAVEKAADKSSKSLGSGGFSGNAKTAQLAAEGMGGRIGELAGKLDKFAQAAGGVNGTLLKLVGSVGAFAAPLVIFTAGTIAAARAAKGWIEDLDAAGVAVNTLDRERITKFNEKLDAFINQAKLVGIAIASHLVDTFNDFARGLGFVYDQLVKVTDFLGVTDKAARDLAATEAQAAKDRNELTEEAIAAQERKIVKDKELAEENAKLAEENAKLAAEKEKRDAKDLAAWKIRNAERIKGIEELAAAEATAREAIFDEWQAKADQSRANADELVAIEEEKNARLLAAQQDINEQFKAENEKAEESSGRIEDIIKESMKSLADSATTGLDMALESTIQNILDQGQLMADGQKKLSEDQRKHLKRTFIAQKAAGLLSANISAAVGAARGFKELPFPIALLNAAAVSAAVGIQIAAINSTAPKFHSGASPDEVQATLVRGESVLSPQGTANAGGAAAVEDLNRGGTGGGAQTVQIQHLYGHVPLGRMWVDAVRTPGPIRDSLSPGEVGQASVGRTSGTGSI